ncbi:DUF4760 domain-containing protein [Caulobacter sp. 602-1]|uniref:DUF4760 domain-containing protein n=1 Tax=Caulobacter sp. 602-1 TaxID=2492472 RepID=UPI000F63F686|nr:DUF4760 domain-containing protein [Caulobacter sp. 602-1]RRN64679.1 DUF4760 domain-containing protein [Caulobacter sp. 602-1]
MALVRTGAILFAGLASVVGGVIGAAAFSYVQAHWPKSITDTEATLITGLLGSFVGFLAVVIAVWGVVSSRAISRRQATLDHLARLEADGTVQKNRQEFNRLVKEKGDLAEFAAKDKEGTPEQQAILSVLNDFELISIGIQRGIIEPALYKRWQHSNVAQTWKNSQQFVVALRARVDRPTLYHEFEEMARWMSQNKIPRRRFWWAAII